MMESDSLSIKTDPKSLVCTTFITTYTSNSAFVYDSKYYYFLLYWISNHLFCTSSQRVVLEFLNLARALAASRRLALTLYVLGHLYKTCLNYIATPSCKIKVALFGSYKSH